MPGQLENKVAFVTGIARGQGRSHAIRLAEEGADIIGLDICRQVDTVFYPMPDAQDLEETKRLVEKAGGRIHAEIADVRDLDAMKAVYDAGVAELGDVDIAVANAGIMPIIDQGVERQAWHDAIDIMLTGVWHTLEVVTPRMIERGEGGSIVVTSSSAGQSSLGVNTFPGSAGYSAAKHGVVGIMRLYASRLAQHSIRVNTVHPTGVDTPMAHNDEFTRFAIANADSVKGFGNALPVDYIESIDISNAIVYLCADSGRYVTGTTLTVDAGYLVKP
ncbi:SDR family mycofactocin-dependent oxidoreductase [Rhodococcus sp. 27YEA15]|uniref:mycofactocin-coupled SDR family oxidoreductase n=1 Tax=Rhodococcus sp. 27YEA15 TaxID=3156259 RepID=UPI003C7D7BF8